MSALTQARSTPLRGDGVVPSCLVAAVAASTKIFQGSLVALDSDGNAIPASATAAVAIGRAEATVDNTDGAAGDLSVEVRTGIFKWANSASTDAIAAADVGNLAYMVDDQTVAKTAAVGRKPAGRIVEVASDGVWVATAPVATAHPPQIVSIPVDLASIVGAGDVVTTYTPGFAGRIEKIEFIVTKPATTEAKAATLNAEIGTTNLTGGAVALTSANCTPLGARVAGSAVTAANYFGPTDTISIESASVTAFAEGQGVLLLTIRPA